MPLFFRLPSTIMIKTKEAISQVISIYGGAFLIGLVMVSFPASSTFLKLTHGFSDQDYGAIFLPQLVLAIVGALGAGVAVQIMTLRMMYICALISFVLSQLFFSLSIFVSPQTALISIMLGTACFGFGFGFGGGPLNGMVCLLFPNKIGTALTSLHMMAGLGLMLGPLFFRVCISIDFWLLAPGTLVSIAVLLLIFSTFITLPGQPDSGVIEKNKLPYRSGYFWLMIFISVLYAFSEGTFSNWAIIYVHESKELSAAAAAAALSAFWGGLTVGRLISSFIVLKVKPRVLWTILPILMIIAFMLLPSIETPMQAIITFAFAGLACSAFFPLMVAVATEPYPYAVSWIASMLTAALMLGVGIGSYVVGILKNIMPLEHIYNLSMIYPILTLIFISVSYKIKTAKGNEL